MLLYCLELEKKKFNALKHKLRLKDALINEDLANNDSQSDFSKKKLNTEDLEDKPIYQQGWVKYFHYKNNNPNKPKAFFKNEVFDSEKIKTTKVKSTTNSKSDQVIFLNNIISTEPLAYRVQLNFMLCYIKIA